jgi:hypothetical protein
MTGISTPQQHVVVIRLSKGGRPSSKIILAKIEQMFYNLGAGGENDGPKHTAY